ncbi:hypothetical protein BH10PSE14_BH10PSE14_44610 [soil metagenome]
MTDSIVLLFACLTQVAVSAALAVLLDRFRPNMGLRSKMAVGAGPLPLLFVALALWMIFGMGRITDIGFMMITTCLFVATILLPIGLIAAYYFLKLLKKSGAE